MFETIKKKTIIQFQPSRACTSFPNPRLTATADVNLNTQPNIEIDKDPALWKYVERILPPVTVPTPTVKAEYPSGWTPQKPEAFNHPYFVRRNRNHMLPVHLFVDIHTTRKRTIIKYINGDIWKLHNEMIDYVEYYMARKTRSKVNEFTQQIMIHGDYVNLIKDWLVKKGF